MCNDPVIIAALVSVGGMVITVIANLLFNFFREKASSEERFFYEILPKRLAVYEDVIKELTAMEKRGRDNLKSLVSFTNAPEQIKDDLHILDGLRARLDFYGSPVARNIIAMLWIEMSVHFSGIASIQFGQKYVELLNIIKDSLFRFLEFTRKEAGADVVDKGIKSLSKEFAKAARRNKVRNQT